MKRPLTITAVLSFLFLLSSCSPAPETVNNGGESGHVGDPGPSGTGGATVVSGSGGTPSSGGVPGSGGQPRTGGSSATGGAPGSGGSRGTGGTGTGGTGSGSGGATSVGGTTGAGGRASGTGGITSTGGTSSTGGAAGTGASSATGGMRATGGSNASGGSTSAGGSSGAIQVTGWASVAECGPHGTTGGDGGLTVTVTTAAALSTAVRSSASQIIQVSGKIDLGDESLQISSNKTLIGVNGAEIVGTTRVYNAKNVILKNIKFNGAKVADGADTAEVTGSTCVWIDHCEFFDGSDGNLDIVRASELVTVSWSKFYYAVRTHDHRLSNLLGNNDSDTPGKINVTFHHNWWGAGVLERMPRVRNGKVHVFNNYYSSVGNNYCIGAGYMSKLVVENNYFDGVKDSIRFQLDMDTAEIAERGNDFTNATGLHDSRGTAFKPSDFYPYSLESALSAMSSVKSRAGVQ